MIYEERVFIEAYEQQNPVRSQRALLAFVILYTVLQTGFYNIDARLLV